MASKVGSEKAGNKDYQTNHFAKMFQEGFSFSGFERDGLYWNAQGKKYRDLSGVSGIDSLSDGRGAVYADFDNDGDTDVFLTTIQGDGHLLFRNNVGSRSGFLRVDLTGAKSGKDAFGAIVKVKTSAGILTKLKAGGSGYLSQHDPRLLFGLGQDKGAEWIEVAWPSGQRDRLGPVAANQSIRILEGRGSIEKVSERGFSLPDPLGPGESLFTQITPRKGEPLPEVPVMKLDGGRTSLQSVLEPGRRYLVNLWATWCSTCPAEMKELQHLREELRGKPVEIVGLSVDTTGNEIVRKFLKEKGIHYPVYLLEQENWPRLYRTEDIAVPMTLLVEADGKVAAAYSGWSAQTQREIRRRLGLSP